MALSRMLPRKIFNLYFHGSRKRKRIALSFDDGPAKETGMVLDILRSNKAKATFFVLGNRIKGREKIINKILREGHEIANHSYSHKRAELKSKEFIIEEIIKCDKELKKFGIKTDLFRPPYFSISPNLFLACNKLKKKIIFCDVGSNDWKKEDVEKITRNVLNKIQKGSIINFHDYLQDIGPNKNILQIVRKILGRLKGKYKFVTVSEIIN